MERYPFYIAGSEIFEGDGEINVVNPATGEAFATVPRASAEQVDEAVTKADSAFQPWSSASPFTRGKILRKAAAIVRERAVCIASLMTREQGKPYSEALGEVGKGADILVYYAEEGERVYGRVIQAPDGPMFRSEVIYQPIGVAAAISPWNYPVELLAWKIGGALAAGCTLVAKVPSETPLNALAFARCVMDAGLPEGVLSAIAGPGRTVGAALVRHPLVRKVAFTGSTAVGREVLRSTADSFKKVSLELGGSLPMLVFADCDLDLAVGGALRRSFRNMGQICIAVNRIFIQRPVYEQFVELLWSAAEKLTIGDGFGEGVDLGPMCTIAGLETVKRHVADAVAKGARLITGGGPPAYVIPSGGPSAHMVPTDGPPAFMVPTNGPLSDVIPTGGKYANGLFYSPTVLADTTPDMLIMREETFGPVVGAAPFDDEDEAVERANDTPYGLAAIVYTKNINTAHNTAMRIRAGNVSVNNPDPGVINAPYGGWQDSGFGCEHGPEGLMEYLHTKHIRTRYKE